MTDAPIDLLLQAGRVVCPATGRDAAGAVAVRGDRIVELDDTSGSSPQRTPTFPDGILLPGLIDLHAHPAKSGSKYGVDPDIEFLPRGVTTVMSQGDTGSANWNVYREETIRGSRIRVRLALSLSSAGESMAGGCFEDPDWVDVDACVSTIEQAGDDIWGIAVNVSRIGCGTTDPQWVLQSALEAAERTGKPLLFGMRVPTDWPLAEQLALLRSGDVLTYSFRGEDWSLVDESGHIRPEVRAARERGVLFDVGHGMASFEFPAAENAIADGFAPDTISSDFHVKHLGSSPPHDLPRVMSKLLAAGMTEHDVFSAVTFRPAAILGLSEEIGSLNVGSCADLTVLIPIPDETELADAVGNRREGKCWQAACVVRAGEIVFLDDRFTNETW
jgi:dihydroorotase